MFFFGGKGLYGLKVGGIAKDGMALLTLDDFADSFSEPAYIVMPTEPH